MMSGWVNAQNVLRKCQFCLKEFPSPNHKRHEKGCLENPANIRFCIVCRKRTKHVDNKTCSYKCSNIAFKRGVALEENLEKIRHYKTKLWKKVEKKCCVCSEDKIVAVHHYDGNHSNDDENNLIPMCPTHHQYMHSRWKHLIEEKVDKYYHNCV